MIQTPEQQYYLSILLGYEYKIQYRSGSSNVVIDALSQIEMPRDIQMFLLSIPNFVFMDQLHQALSDNPVFQEKLQSTMANLSSYSDFKMHNGLIMYKGSIWLDSANPFIQALLMEFHNAPLEVTWALPKLSTDFSPISFGIIWGVILNFLWDSVTPVNKSNTFPSVPPDFCNLSPFRPRFGKICLWILSHTFQVHKGSRLS